ncbi:uncharacterized protein LOC110838268 [Zootermopsis nevadensis]|uniref:Hemolymph lipopolysaccharide-binding protein n=1 Tax=Zootermopsis nevadensis TaxID=136037 RepID=A0A067QNU9_ZOONE|nr:uncharacterized protein LOC110838268 [Zootermopsis nevadensis]KDR10088.1 Hemolymph lipopolysaccharide-binding protein [Zootermopsis nevadensis]
MMRLCSALLCVTLAWGLYREGTTQSHEGKPLVETSLRLEAPDSDTGDWTAEFGGMKVQIEHRHADRIIKEDGSWTLDIARATYDKEEDTDRPKDETDKISTTTEIPKFTGIPLEEYSGLSEADKIADTENEIPVDERWSKRDHTEGVRPQDPGIHPLEMFEIVPRVEQGTSFAEESYDSDEVTLDPDNFEYFKGVGWFKLDNRNLQWPDARDACAEVGAHLAVPDTPQRVTVFLKLFKRHPDIPARAILRQQVYVGVSDPDRSRHFTTVQGKPFAPEFPIWFRTEPDNAPPGEYCVTFHIEGRTRDVPCFYELPFFCEKDIPVVI